MSRLPTELQVLIAESLDMKTLKSYRLACKALATAGYDSLCARAPYHLNISNSRISDFRRTLPRILTYERRAASFFLTEIDQILQRTLPKVAARVTALEVADGPELPNGAYVRGSPTKGLLRDIRLPSLTVLVLRQLSTMPDALQAVLQNHEHTLQTLRLHNVSLEMSADVDVSLCEAWAAILISLKERLLQVCRLEINAMTGFNDATVRRVHGFKVRHVVAKGVAHLDFGQPHIQDWDQCYRTGINARDAAEVARGLWRMLSVDLRTRAFPA